MNKLRGVAIGISIFLIFMSVMGAFLYWVGDPLGRASIWIILSQTFIFLIALVMIWLAYWLTKVINYSKKTLLFIVLLTPLFLTVIPIARFLSKLILKF